MKILQLVIMLLAVLSGTARAMEYTVESGDTRIGIAKNLTGKASNYVAITRKDGKPFGKYIYKKDVLIIPDELLKKSNSVIGKSATPSIVPEKAKKKAVKKATQPKVQPKVHFWNPGRNPWKGSLEQGVKGLNFSPQGEKVLIEKRRADSDRLGVTIYPDGRVIDEKGREFRMTRMGFGKGKFIDNPVPAWGKKNPGHREAGWLYESQGEFLMYPFKCWNPTRLEIVSVPSPVVTTFIERSPEKEASPITTYEEETSPAPRTPVTYVQSKCDPEIEATVGAYIYINAPGKDWVSRGLGGYAELMYWQNCNSADCSSEYWWGVGGIASAYEYSSVNLPSQGDGWRVAGEGGIKRIWEEDAKNRMWKVKARLGWEESEWENPQTNKSIEQIGPVYGPYAEYVHELQRNKLWFVSQNEAWFGFNQKVSGPSEWNISPQSRTFLEALAGFDYRIDPRWTLRAQTGLGYQGWDSESFLPWNLQAMYELGENHGRIAFGPYGQFYFSGIDPTIGAFVRYDSGDLIREFYGDSRVKKYKFNGKQLGESDASK